SARDERHGLLATLWFNVAHYALRPWPWILTALASLVLYPELVDKESGYIKTLMDPNIFPTYLRGFMLAAFAAAYMSTIGTQLNWGASYVINDFYRRFVVRHSGERHYVIASQVVTLLLMVVSLVVTFNLGSIGGAWKLLHFYRKVKPEGPGWRRIAAEAGAGRSDAGGGLTAQFANWFLGCVFIYASLFGIGKLVFKEWGAAVLYGVVAVAAAALFSRSLSRAGWQSFSADEAGLKPK